MNSEDFVVLLEDVLEIEAGSLTLDSPLDGTLDSLAILGLLAALDNRGITSVTADSLSSALTVGELYVRVFPAAP